MDIILTLMKNAEVEQEQEKRSESQDGLEDDVSLDAKRARASSPGQLLLASSPSSKSMHHTW